MADFLAPAELITSARRGMAAGECERDARVADTAIIAGRCVVQGAGGDATCKLPASAAEVAAALGVSEYLAMREPGTSAEYAAADVVNFVTEGDIWVEVEGAVDAGGLAYVRYSVNGGSDQLGKFRADADTSHAAALGRSIYVTSTSGAGLARVRVRI